LLEVFGGGGVTRIKWTVISPFASMVAVSPWNCSGFPMIRTVCPGCYSPSWSGVTNEFLAEGSVDAGSWFLHPWKLVTSCGRVALIFKPTPNFK